MWVGEGGRTVRAWRQRSCCLLVVGHNGRGWFAHDKEAPDRLAGCERAAYGCGKRQAASPTRSCSTSVQFCTCSMSARSTSGAQKPHQRHAHHAVGTVVEDIWR
jgi:hypothetical protein